MIDLFNDYTFQIVATASLFLGATSGMLGCYMVLSKKSLIADGISHSALPGVVIIFAFFQRKELGILLIGALITGLLAQYLLEKLSKSTTVTFDTALAIILSTFFGLGMMGLSYIQRQPSSNQAGLSSFIFGQASTILSRDLWLIVACFTLLLVLIILNWKELLMVTFDKEFCQVSGFNTKLLDGLLSLMCVLSIMVGLQTVGVILMSAMTIAPACAARQWSNRLSSMLFLSAIFGAFAGVGGTLLSSSFAKTPTGPAIVIVLSTITFISMLIAPKRGVLAKVVVKRKLCKEIIKRSKNGC